MTPPASAPTQPNLGAVFRTTLDLFQKSPQPLLIGGGLFTLITLANTFFWQSSLLYDWLLLHPWLVCLVVLADLFLLFFIPLALNRYYDHLITHQRTSLSTIPGSLPRFFPVLGVALLFGLSEILLTGLIFGPICHRFWVISSPFLIDLGRYFQSHAWTDSQLQNYFAQHPELFGSDLAIINTLLTGATLMKTELIYTCLAMIGGAIISVYFHTRFYFAALICTLNDHSGPLTAFRRSWRLTHGHFWPTFGFILLNNLIFSMGSVLFGLGYIFIQPFCRNNDLNYWRQLGNGTQTQTASSVATKPKSSLS